MSDILFRKHKFKESKKQTVFTCLHIIEEHKPILYVTHDIEGGWQFLCGENHTTADGRIVALQEIIKLDPAVCKTSNLKRGQIAVRESKEKEWKLL